MVASSSGIYLGSLQLSAGTTQLPQQSNPGRALASGLSRPRALFCGRQTWHRSHTPVTPDALFIHTPHGHALDLADALEICGCIVPVRFSGDRRGHEKVPHGLQEVHTRSRKTGTKCGGGKHYREGGTWTLEGGTLGGETTGSFPVYDSHAISGERRGHAKSRRPHHTGHRLQDCSLHTHRHGAEKHFFGTRRILVLCGVFSGRTGTRCL